MMSNIHTIIVMYSCTHRQTHISSSSSSGSNTKTTRWSL